MGYLGSAVAQLDEAVALQEQAVKLFNEGRHADSEPLFKRTLAILESSVGANHRYVASPLSFLGRIYDEQGRYKEAERYLSEL